MDALPNTGSPSGPMGFAQPSTVSLPLLTLGATDDPADFDYSAYFQEQQEDMDYLAEESSASHSTPPRSSPHSDGSLAAVSPPPGKLLLPSSASSASSALALPRAGPASATGTGPRPSKPRLERRGHTKSRRGCFNCKRRRIKCQETKPACGHCVKSGLKCEYPALPTIVHQPQHQIPLFTLQDMRFFQHFLFQCYPHHPIGSEELWTHEIPCLSQKHDYLMHAILGYSASDLLLTDASLLEPAMAHRLKAIKAIKRALSDVAASSSSASASASSSSSPSPCSCSPRSAAAASSFDEEQGNALIATCFALTYQSVLLDDGMAEYMTFIRGIMIVAVQMYVRGERLLFGEFMGDDAREARLQPLMERVPLIDAGWAAAAEGAVARLGAVVDAEGGRVERRYWELIGEMARLLRVSSWEAYRAMTEHYGWWMTLPHDQFQRLVDPGNQLAILLATHWIALKQIMAVILEAEHQAAAKMPDRRGEGRGEGGSDPYGGITRWLRYLNRQVDQAHRPYNDWPLWVQAQLDRDYRFFGRSY